MENKDDKWLQDLRSRLNDYEEPASDRLWKSIERDLPGNASLHATSRKLRIARIATIAACVAVVCGVYFLIKEDATPPIDISTPSQQQVISANVRQPEAEPVAKPKQPVMQQTTIAQLRREEQAATPTPEKTSDPEAIAAIPNTIADTAANKPIKKTTRNMPLFEKDSLETSGNVYASSFRSNPSNNDESTWGLALAVGNNFGSQNESKGGFISMTRAPLLGLQNGDQFDALYTEMAANNIDEETRTDVEYDMPITYSATLRYKLTDRWGIDAGLSFSQLGMSWRSGSSSSFYRSKQKMFFIGIPVGVSFTVFDSRFVSVYATAGGSVEKCVAGNIKDVLNIEDHTGQPQNKRSLDEHPWQYSLKAGAGVQFNITKNYGIFAEPQAAWYFDNAKIPLRKDNKPDFNLSVGVRYTY